MSFTLFFLGLMLVIFLVCFLALVAFAVFGKKEPGEEDVLLRSHHGTGSTIGRAIAEAFALANGIGEE